MDYEMGSGERRLNDPMRNNIIRNNQEYSSVPSGFVHFQRDRKHFIAKVYILAIAFIFLTAIQWLIILLNRNLIDFFKQIFNCSLLACFTVLLMFTIFSNFDELRYNPPWNWILVFFMVEMTTFGMVRSVLDFYLYDLVIYFLLTALIFVGFTFIGFELKRDLTLDIVIMNVISLVFYLLISILLVMVIVLNLYFSSIFFAILLIIILLVYIMYNAQAIFGTRSGTVRWSEYLLAALMVYFNFIVMFVLILYVVCTLSKDPFEGF